MIYENEVPEAISRRKIIADSLKIPPMLFGLAVLEEVRLQPHPQIARANLVTRPTKLTKVIVDTTKYENTIHTLLTLHNTGPAQNTLAQINIDIRDLESLESQARGDLLYHIRELLFSYQILAAKIQRDQRKYGLSHHHANQSVRIAKTMKDTDLIATSLYVRGLTYLQWGRFGILEQGVFKVQEDKINKAIRDLEAAKKVGEKTEKGLHPQLVGFLDVHLSRAYAIRSLSVGEKISPLVITLLDSAEDKIDRENIDDPYTRELIIGSQVGFVRGIYHNNRAVNLSLAGLAGASLKEINTLEDLHQGTIGKQFTRTQIWIDITAANTFMGLEHFDEATTRVKRALIAARDIDSRSYLANAVDIHGRLLKIPYKNDANTQELGDMIHEIAINRIQQEEEQLVMEKDY